MRTIWRFLKPEDEASCGKYGSLVAAVMDAGGRILEGPTEIAGVGQYVSFIDTVGDRVYLFQPIPGKWHTSKPEQGNQVQHDEDVLPISQSSLGAA